VGTIEVAEDGRGKIDYPRGRSMEKECLENLAGREKWTKNSYRERKVCNEREP
jgi:hypothetical protein